MDRNVLNNIVNILCTNIDRIVFSNEYMNNIILEYKDIKSITIVGNK